jgi:tetratricopeptide (TPR) repeat protein
VVNEDGGDFEMNAKLGTQETKRQSFKTTRWFVAFGAHSGFHVAKSKKSVLLALCAFLLIASAPSRAAFDKDKKYVREQATRALRDGEYAQAEKMFRDLLAENERDEQARLGLSFALLKQQKVRGAYDEAMRVLATNSTSSRAHALIGTAFLMSGNFPRAADSFQKSLNFNPSEPMAIAGFALIDFYESRLSDSIEGLRRAARLEPNEPDYQFHLAQAAARAERYAEAANAYERFLRIAPRADADRRARIRGLIDFLRYLGAQRNLYQVPKIKRPQTIPFEIINNRPVLTVRINDRREPLRFVLDTGSGMCVISDATAEKFGLRPIARGGNARAIGGGGKFEIVYGFLDALRFETDGANELRIEKVPVYIRPFLNSGEQVDGYIGLTVLSKFLTTVDYASRAMTLERNDKKSNAKANNASDATANAKIVEIPIRTTSSGFWSGEVRVEGIDAALNFIVDTGASISVVSSDLVEFAKLERWLQGSRLRVYGAAGVTEDVPVLLLPRMMLGAQTHANVTAVVLNLEALNETAGFTQTGILGGNLLKNLRLTFDFQRGVLRLEPRDFNETALPSITSARRVK